MESNRIGFPDLHASSVSEVDDESCNFETVSRKCTCDNPHSSDVCGDSLDRGQGQLHRNGVFNRKKNDRCTLSKTVCGHVLQGHDQQRPNVDHLILGRSAPRLCLHENYHRPVKDCNIDTAPSTKSQRYEYNVEGEIDAGMLNLNCVPSALTSAARRSLVNNHYLSDPRSEDDRLYILGRENSMRQSEPCNSTTISSSPDSLDEACCTAVGISQTQISEGGKKVTAFDNKEPKIANMDKGDANKCKFEIVGISGTCKITGRSKLTSNLVDMHINRNLPYQDTDSSDEIEEICRNALEKLSTISHNLGSEEMIFKRNDCSSSFVDGRDSPYMFSNEAMEALCIDDSRYKFTFCSDQSAAATDVESSQDRDQESDVNDTGSKVPKKISSPPMASSPAETNGIFIMKSDVTLNHFVPTSCSKSVPVNDDDDDDDGVSRNDDTKTSYWHANMGKTILDESIGVEQRVSGHLYQLQERASNHPQLELTEISDPVVRKCFAVDLHGRVSPQNSPCVALEEQLSFSDQTLVDLSVIRESGDGKSNPDARLTLMREQDCGLEPNHDFCNNEDEPPASDGICITPSLSINSKFESRSLDLTNVENNSLCKLEDSLSLPDFEHTRRLVGPRTPRKKRKGRKPGRKKSLANGENSCRANKVKSITKTSDHDTPCLGNNTTISQLKNSGKKSNSTSGKPKIKILVSAKSEASKSSEGKKVNKCELLRPSSKVMSHEYSKINQADAKGIVFTPKPRRNDRSDKCQATASCPATGSDSMIHRINRDSHSSGFNSKEDHKISLQKHMTTIMPMKPLCTYDRSSGNKPAGSHSRNLSKPIGAIEALGISLQRQANQAIRARDRNCKSATVPVSEDTIKSQIKSRKSMKPLRSRALPANDKIYKALHKVPNVKDVRTLEVNVVYM